MGRRGRRKRKKRCERQGKKDSLPDHDRFAEALPQRTTIATRPWRHRAPPITAGPVPAGQRSFRLTRGVVWEVFFAACLSHQDRLAPESLTPSDLEPVERGVPRLVLFPVVTLVVMEGRVAAWTEALQRRWTRALPDGLRRVKFLKSMPQPEFLHLLATADVILDPYPFCGGNTSYEAFAVGTPVVTHPGRFLRGRLTFGMYRQMGLESLIAASAAEYAPKAVELGCDAALNQKIRRELREAAGALFENPQEVRGVERALQRWVEEGTSSFLPAGGRRG